MTSPKPLWRAILWVERFLPAAPALPQPERSEKARRRAALVPLLVMPTVVVPMLVRQRRELGEIVMQNRASLAELMLVAAGCVAIAAVGFGVKAWCDARSAG